MVLDLDDLDLGQALGAAASEPVSVAAVASTWPCIRGAKLSRPVTSIVTSFSVSPTWFSSTCRFWRVPLDRL